MNVLQEKTKVCAYARFSSQNQRVESIETQFDTIEKYCKANNLEIVAKYSDEARSGLNDDRAGFKQMIEDSKQGNWKAIILYSLDRFGRNAMNHYYYKNILDSYGIRIIAILDGLDGDDNPEKGLLSNIKIGLAEYYSAHLSKVILDASIMGARNSLKMGGIDNLGFNTIDQIYYINEEEAKIVKRIFELAYNDKTIPEIRDIINQEGYKTKLGNSFSNASLQFILRNRKYDGQMVYNMYKHKEKITSRTHKKILKPEKEHVIVKDAIPRIIDHNIFEMVQMKLDKLKDYRFKAGLENNYLLSGITFCSLCGAKLYGETQSCGKNKIKRRIYRCSHKKMSNGGCKCKTINSNYLDEYMIMLLDRLFLKDDSISRIKEAIKQMVSQVYENEQKKLIALNNELANTNNEIDKLTVIAQQSSGIAKETIMSAIQAKMDDNMRCQGEIVSLKAEIDKREPIKFANIDKMINEYKEAKDNEDIKELRRIIFSLLNRLDVGNERIEFIFDLKVFTTNFTKELLQSHIVSREKVAIKIKKP